jgi:hypothetical protein
VDDADNRGHHQQGPSHEEDRQLPLSSSAGGALFLRCSGLSSAPGFRSCPTARSGCRLLFDLAEVVIAAKSEIVLFLEGGHDERFPALRTGGLFANRVRILDPHLRGAMRALHGDGAGHETGLPCH